MDNNISTDDYNIYNQCCVIGLNKMKESNEKVHLTVTSPPYYNVKEYSKYKNYKEYLDTLKQIFSLIYDITYNGRMCCVNISNIIIQRENRNSESTRIPLAFHFISLMEEIGWKFIEDIIWEKPDGSSKNRNGGFFQHRQPIAYKPNIVNEYIFVFQKPIDCLIDKIINKYDAVISESSKVEEQYERTNIWKINPETKVKHPAPFPEILSTNLIKYYSFIGDLVLDPFFGSGTTCISSYKLNRKFIGYEIHKEYIDIFEDRIKDVLKNKYITNIEIDFSEYNNLDEEQIKNKLLKKSKKYLLEILDNDKQYKSLSKNKIIENIYNLLFVKKLT
jgi:DNA modification methylase